MRYRSQCFPFADRQRGDRGENVVQYFHTNFDSFRGSQFPSSRFREEHYNPPEYPFPRKDPKVFNSEVIKGGELEVLSCSTTEAVGLAATAGIPLNATEEVFEHGQLLHPGPPEEDGDPIQLKAKVTLH
jgi:hypothetical protein